MKFQAVHFASSGVISGKFGIGLMVLSVLEGGGVFLDENVSIKTRSTVFRYYFKT